MNRIFACENKKTKETVLLRLYGGKLVDKSNLLSSGSAIENEVLVFHAMSRAGVAPPLLGVFPGGRLEHFFTDASVLTSADCRDASLMRTFAR